MTKRTPLNKAQLDLKQRILSAYRRPYGFSYVYPDWGAKLWKKSTSDIYEFLEGRFRETLDVVEYYSTMVLLWKTMPNSELLVEFHDSPQWLEAAKTYEVAKTYDHMDGNKPVSRSEQKSIESSAQPVETVKSVGTVYVIGDD